MATKTNGQDKAARKNTNITFDFTATSIPMRRCIIKAWEMGNASAVTARDAGFCDVPTEDFNLWVFRINQLREVAVRYGQAVECKTTDQKTIDTVRGELFQMWKALLKVGESELAHPNMFCRAEDADTLRVYATGITWVHAEGVGSCMATTDPSKFRRMVELLIGCRIAGNKLLNDDDRDIIQQWNSSEKTIQSNTERLEGNAEKKQDGLKKQLSDAEDAVSTAESLLVSAIGEEQARYVIDTNPSFKGMRSKVAEIQRQIDSCKKSIHDARNWQSIHGIRYRQIIATLNRIEYPATNVK